MIHFLEINGMYSYKISCHYSHKNQIKPTRLVLQWCHDIVLHICYLYVNKTRERCILIELMGTKWTECTFGGCKAIIGLMLEKCAWNT